MRQQAVTQADETDSMDGALAALRQSIARWTDKEGLLETALPGLSFARRNAPTPPTSTLYEPSICVIAQGVKRVLLGDDTYVLDAHRFLITSVRIVNSLSPKRSQQGLLPLVADLLGLGQAVAQQLRPMGPRR